MNGQLRVDPEFGYVVVVLSNFGPPTADIIADFFTLRVPVDIGAARRQQSHRQLRAGRQPMNTSFVRCTRRKPPSPRSDVATAAASTEPPDSSSN